MCIVAVDLIRYCAHLLFVIIFTVRVDAAVSVSVGVWTLVALSLERYAAICRPLQARQWQTRRHAYRSLAFVWVAAGVWSVPAGAASALQALSHGNVLPAVTSMPLHRFHSKNETPTCFREFLPVLGI